MSETKFLLWNYYVFYSGSECRFDVTPYNFVQLANGTKELMQEFVRSLKLEESIVEWKIEPFCSPYFSRGRKEHFRDRNPMAWEVHVQFEQDISYVKPTLVLGITATSEAWDDTWKEEEDSWEWFKRRCIIIANNVDQNEAIDLQLQERVSPLCINMSQVRLHERVVQHRFDLGEILFPEEEEKILSVLGICKQFGAQTNVDEAMHFEAGNLL
jgi:hypothetical protein